MAMATDVRRPRGTVIAGAASLLAVGVMTGSAVVPHGQPHRAEAVTPALPPFSLDDGSLVVTPVTARDTAVSADRAREVLALQPVYVTSVHPPVLAVVRWHANDIGSGPTRLTVRPGTLAWVITYRTRDAQPSCPTAFMHPTSRSGSDESAVIIDASTGQAAVYSGSHQFCSAWTRPTIAGAARYVSLPWVIDAASKDTPDPYGVTLPGCAVLTGSWSDNFEMTMIGAEPLDGACSGPRRTQYDEGTASPRYATHAPTGLLCVGHDPTIHLLRPKGCVKQATV